MLNIIEKIKSLFLTQTTQTYQCPNCGNTLHSTDHARRVPPGSPSKLPGIYWTCPHWLTGRSIYETGCGGRNMRTWELADNNTPYEK